MDHAEGYMPFSKTSLYNDVFWAPHWTGDRQMVSHVSIIQCLGGRGPSSPVVV